MSPSIEISISTHLWVYKEPVSLIFQLERTFTYEGSSYKQNLFYNHFRYKKFGKCQHLN